MKILKNKWLLGGLAVVVLGGGYWWYSSSNSSAAATRYTLAAVEKGTVISTVSGAGQVSGNRQLDIKPKASGDVVAVLVKVGDTVKAGQPMIELDRTNAQKTVRDAGQSVRDAKISLDSAQLSLQKAKLPSDSVSLLQAKNSLEKAQRDLQELKDGPTAYELKQAQADIASAEKNVRMTSDASMPQVVRDAYDAAVTTLQSANQTISKSVQDSDGILGIDKPVSKSGLTRLFAILNDSTRFQAEQSYQSAKLAAAAAKTEVDSLKQVGEDISRIDAAADSVTDALDKASVLLADVTDGLQATLTSSDLTTNDLDSLKSMIESDRSSVNSKITSMQNLEQAVRQANDTYDSGVIAHQRAVDAMAKLKEGATASELATAQDNVKQAQAQYDKLSAGADPIDLKIAQNSLDRSVSSLAAAQNKLDDANQALSDYTVRAPFDGIVATVAAQLDGEASAGSSAVTLLTSQQVATMSLNEVDVAKVKLGQKATLIFDAIEGLTITGEVAEVSPLGTVTQGVVNYDIKIAFDGQDERIKSGMSVSATIITEVKADVLAVANAAVKSQGDIKYVEVLDNLPKTAASSTDSSVSTTDTPQRVQVQVGISSDTLTEITDGLKEGEKIIVQTIKSTASTAGSQTGGGSMLRVGGAAPMRGL